MAKTMAAVVQYDLTPGAVEVRELPVPEIADDEVLLHVGGVSVCGSDVHQYHASQSWPVRTPVILGHEFGGTVAAAGRLVKSFKEGDRVVSETAAYICGKCMMCRTGAYNLCPERKGFGYGINGAMAGYVKVPERCLHPIPDSLPFEKAALTEPCCVGYNCVVEKSKVKPGDTVVVLGPGPIGLLCAEMARLAGAGTLIMAGMPQDKSRLEAAKALGVTHAINLQETNLTEFVRSIGDGLGAHLVVDAAGDADRLVRRAEVGVAADLERDLAAQPAEPRQVLAGGGLGQLPPDVQLDRAFGRAATALDQQGWGSELRAQGVQVVTDTCTYLSPVLSGRPGAVMTNSAKWAYYAPGTLGLDVVFGSLRECVESAVRGEVWRDRDLWADL